jgi:DNA integrity scanning protein DisA with diadenylate cyclase activity
MVVICYTPTAADLVNEPNAVDNPLTNIIPYSNTNMSYTLSPIAVKLDEVNAVFGSKNKKLLAQLVKEFADDFEQIDSMATDYVDEDEGEAAFTCEQALTHMIMGEEYVEEEFGFVYGYSFEFLCRHFGDSLSNDNWSAMRYAWAERVDQELKALKIGEKTLRIVRLMERGAPVTLPDIDDFPGIGYMTLKEIESALNVLTPEKLATIKDKEVQDALTEVRGWLETCVNKKCDLICFYS